MTEQPNLCNPFTYVGEQVGIEDIPDQPGVIYYGVGRSSVGATDPRIETMMDRSTKILAVARRLYPRPESDEYQKVFVPILKANQIGLVGEDSNIDIALSQINKIEEQFLVENVFAVINRDRFAMLKWAASAAVALLLLFAFSMFLQSWHAALLKDSGLSEILAPALFLVLAASMPGVYACYWLAGKQYTLDDVFQRGGLTQTPFQIIVLTWILTGALCLFLHQEFVVLSIGKFSTSEILQPGGDALVFGLACGCVYPLLPDTVMRFPKEIMDRIRQSPMQNGSGAGR